MWIQEVGRLPKILQLQEISCELVAMEIYFQNQDVLVPQQ
jgi:hypothetical protein